MTIPLPRTAEDVERDLIEVRANLLRARGLGLSSYEHYSWGVIDRLLDEISALRHSCPS